MGRGCIKSYTVPKTTLNYTVLVLSKCGSYSDYAAVKIDPNTQSTKISIPC